MESKHPWECLRMTFGIKQMHFVPDLLYAHILFSGSKLYAKIKFPDLLSAWANIVRARCGVFVKHGHSMFFCTYLLGHEPRVTYCALSSFEAVRIIKTGKQKDQILLMTHYHGVSFNKTLGPSVLAIQWIFYSSEDECDARLKQIWSMLFLWTFDAVPIEKTMQKEWQAVLLAFKIMA